MTNSTRSLHPGFTGTALLGLGVAAATVLAGCTDGGGEGGGGPTVPVGASAAEYQAALADMAPIQLVVQSSASSESSAQSLIAFMDRITEYSGDKITFEVFYANSLVPTSNEIDEALVDGRLDIASYSPATDGADYRANLSLVEASVLRDPRLITGWLSSTGWMQELALSTPEVTAEWANKGIIPLNVVNPGGPTMIACRMPVTTLDELAGKKIQVTAGTVQARQIEALGAVPVSLAFPEVYEGLLRSTLDCVVSSHLAVAGQGLVEIASYLIQADTQSFASGSGSLYAGPRVAQLPHAAQQLIVESAQHIVATGAAGGVSGTVGLSYEQIAEHGGSWLAFAPEVDERLAAVNAEILADLAASTALDGAAFVDRAEELSAKWVTLVGELGYTDEGPIGSLPEWLPAPPQLDSAPLLDALLEQVITPYAPV